jgi:type IV pilus assembly protein PilY1
MKTVFNLKKTVLFILGICSSYSVFLQASPLAIENAPLFTTSAVKSNLILAIDDSGSMDSEVLFPANDGALWWNTAGDSYVSSGAVNFNISGSANSTWKKFTYLFPNGTGTGKRVYGDSSHHHYAIPPFAQYAFTRSSEFNKMYYNPNETYSPWASEGSTTFGDIIATAAPSDPTSGTSTLNLVADRESSSNHKKFRMYTGMVIPNGTYYYDGSNWQTAGSDITVPGGNVSNAESVGVRYYPATYYTKLASGSYTVNGTSGDCSSPVASHYVTFESNPSSLSGVDALGPDGTCLSKVEIKSATTSYTHNGSRTDCASATSCSYSEEIQNFANWYSYFRKRHLALRSGMGQAFTGMSSIRTGLFTINNRSDVTMWDLDSSANTTTFYNTLYGIDGNGGGTPNRTALKYAGEQFKRTNTGAPITEACQKNFTLLFTDGFSTTSNEGVGNADGSSGVPYQDAIYNSLADIAMTYYNTTLRTGGSFPVGGVPVPAGCNVTSPTPILDCNTNLHMNTFTVGLGNKGTIFGVTHNNIADAYSVPPTWPNVNSARDPRQIDDLYHAAVNGRGEMFNADSASDLQAKLKQALLGVQAQIGVASAVSFNTATLQTNSAVYLAFFNSGNWSGDVVSFELDSVGNIDLTTTWSAATVLDTPNPSANSRVIITYNDTSKVGIPFRWDTSVLSAAQQADFNSVGWSPGLDALNYIRGDRSNEGSGKYRVRASALGDIVNSAPKFVGIPNLNWPNTAPFPATVTSNYSTFRSALLATPRQEMLYFGGNDGMLHGVAADTGVEKLAYIPHYLFSNAATAGLHYLTDPTYQHRYFVDLPSTVSDVNIDKGSGLAWRTILIGGSRAGGRGIFALDITDPATFSEANAGNIALWEFTHPDLGLTYSKPTISMMENGKWAAIFGNGYNDTGTGKAKLFIVYIDGGLDGVWTLGTDYFIIETPSGSTATPNGLATPAIVDLDGNGAADRAYAGDLNGNLWVFDLSDTATPANWGIAYQATTGGPDVPLFIAEDFSGNPQPITNKPSVAFHPNYPNSGSHDPDLMVFFGTGKYLESTDLTDTSIQSFYGIWDDGSSELKRGDLIAQTFISGSFADSDGNELRVITDNAVGSSKNGWLIDLPASGERVVVDSAIRGSLVFFNTWIPSSSACESGGKGFLMSVEQLNGGEPDQAAFDSSGDGVVDDSDIVTDGITDFKPAGQEFDNGLPAASAFLSDKQYTPGTGNNDINVRNVQNLGGGDTGRLSWQQLFAD